MAEENRQEMTQEMTQEQFEAELMAKEEVILKNNLFAVHNQVRLGTVKKDYAEVYMDIVPDTLNFRGSVHGGAYFTMADVCSGIVCRTDGRTYVTQQANVQYVRAVSGGRLTAVGTVIHRGRTSCLTEIRVTGASGKLVFLGTFLFHCTG